jgi:hypothetical protein
VTNAALTHAVAVILPNPAAPISSVYGQRRKRVRININCRI